MLGQKVKTITLLQIYTTTHQSITVDQCLPWQTQPAAFTGLKQRLTDPKQKFSACKNDKRTQPAPEADGCKRACCLQPSEPGTRIYHCQHLWSDILNANRPNSTNTGTEGSWKVIPFWNTDIKKSLSCHTGGIICLPVFLSVIQKQQQKAHQ